jgi:NAD(P)H-hydrate epimerase
MNEYTYSDACNVTLKRNKDSHKGEFGKVLIVAGSVGLAGAAVLTARSCVRGGAGLTYLAIPEELYTIAVLGSPETIAFPRTESRVLELLETCDLCAIGPGLGQSPELDNLVCEVITRSRKPLIIDADGINAISRHINVLDAASCPIVLTPHEGEFARLAPNDGASRERRASDFAVKHHCTLVLKGSRTVTAYPDGGGWLNTSGNPAMAKGGSGDVLTGVMAALACQTSLEAAVPLAVYVHGLAGDICCERLGELSVTASDIIEALPSAFTSLRNLL